MAVIFFVVLLGLPIAELWVIVQVAQEFGVLETLALLIAISVAGAWLLRSQGAAAWRRLQAALARGEVPAAEVLDGALIVVGGALLLTPGFITDVFGLFLLVPVTRAIAKRFARRSAGWWAGRRWTRVSGRRIYEGRVVSSERTETFSVSPNPLPYPEAPNSEDGSRDRE